MCTDPHNLTPKAVLKVFDEHVSFDDKFLFLWWCSQIDRKMSWQSYVDEQVRKSPLWKVSFKINFVLKSFFSSQFHLFTHLFAADRQHPLNLLINSTFVQLIASGMVTAAAIAGHDGNIWAKSNGFNASPDEVVVCQCVCVFVNLCIFVFVYSCIRVYLAYNNCLLALFNKIKSRWRGCSATGDQTWRWAESLSTPSSKKQISWIQSVKQEL